MGIVGTKIVKEFGNPAITILKSVDLEIKEGELFSITGRSGSGKSTLLYILSSLDSPSSGSVSIDDIDIHKIESEAIHQFRNTKMGFVFQFHYLLPELTATENVLMPALKSGIWDKKKDYAHHLLKQFGLEHRLHHRPSQLSGGEQQRVSIARALIMKPKYLFADEPTGNLDSVNGKIVMDILKQYNIQYKMTVIYVTHDESYAAMAHRRIHLVDGKIERSLNS